MSLFAGEKWFVFVKMVWKAWIIAKGLYFRAAMFTATLLGARVSVLVSFCKNDSHGLMFNWISYLIKNLPTEGIFERASIYIQRGSLLLCPGLGRNEEESALQNSRLLFQITAENLNHLEMLQTFLLLF